MGIKTKAAMAIAILLVFFVSMWLQGGLENHWNSCLKGFSQEHKPVIITMLNDTDSESDINSVPLAECPGQDFQVSKLLSHLQSSPVSSSDVLLTSYLSSWDELIKFMDALGPMVSLISQEIEGKTSIIRELAQEDAERQKRAQEEEVSGGEGHLRPTTEEGNSEAVRLKAGPQASDTEPITTKGEDTGRQESESYLSIRSMIRLELTRGMVDFEEQNNSGCRTLLRLHRALLWLQLFLKNLGEVPADGRRLQSPSELCRLAYQQTLAHHHPWLVRRAAELAFIAMPNRKFFFRLMCVQNQEEAASVLNRVVRAIGEVYQRTQAALQEHDMLNLP